MSRLWVWVDWLIWQPRHYWSFIATLLVLYAAARWFHFGETGTVRAGVTLQVIGFLITLRGIGKTLKQLGLEGVMATLRDRFNEWCAALPLLRKDQVIAATGMASGTSSTSGTVWPSEPPNASLEQRLETVKQQVEILREMHSKTNVETSSRFKALQADLTKEISIRTAETKELAKKSKAIFVDGLGLQLLGVAYFVAGIVIAGLPKDIAGLLAAFPSYSL